MKTKADSGMRKSEKRTRQTFKSTFGFAQPHKLKPLDLNPVELKPLDLNPLDLKSEYSANPQLVPRLESICRCLPLPLPYSLALLLSLSPLSLGYSLSRFVRVAVHDVKMFMACQGLLLSPARQVCKQNWFPGSPVYPISRTCSM